MRLGCRDDRDGPVIDRSAGNGPTIDCPSGNAHVYANAHTTANIDADTDALDAESLGPEQSKPDSGRIVIGL